MKRLILSSGKLEPACMLPKLCPPSDWATNHGRWPNGIDDGTGVDFEPEMLDFLKTHSLGDSLARAACSPPLHPRPTQAMVHGPGPAR